MVRSFARLQEVDKGFSPDGLLSFELSLSGERYRSAADVLGFHEALLDRLGALGVVESVGGVTVLPFTTASLSSDVVLDGQPREDLEVEFRSISREYLRTMQIPLLHGRALDPKDTAGSLPVTLVNRTLASLAWPGADPIGRTITIFQQDWTVVGVVGDVRHFGLEIPPGPEMYVPFRQQPRRYMVYAMRTTDDPASLVSTVRELVWEADADLPISDIASMSDRVWQSAAAPRSRTRLLGVFAATALMLAAIGVYGVTAFAVSRRVREIGIRKALGARSGAVVALVVGRGMAHTGIGVGIGLATASVLTRSLRSLLFEIEPLDLPTFVGAAVLLAAAALLGCLLPALRAAAVHPIAAIGNSAESPYRRG